MREGEGNSHTHTHTHRFSVDSARSRIPCTVIGLVPIDIAP